MAAWEGTQLLLAKVKNASSRIGIFSLPFTNETENITSDHITSQWANIYNIIAAKLIFIVLLYMQHQQIIKG